MKSGTMRMSRWHCYLLMLLHQASWLAWTLVITLIVLVTFGFLHSVATGIASIGLGIFIVVMAMNFVIFAYGFNSITGINITEHALRLEGPVIAADIVDEKSVEIKREHLRPYHIYPGGVLVPVEGNRKGWLWIKASAFDTPEEFQKFMKKIYESNSE